MDSYQIQKYGHDNSEYYTTKHGTAKNILTSESESLSEDEGNDSESKLNELQTPKALTEVESDIFGLSESPVGVAEPTSLRASNKLQKRKTYRKIGSEVPESSRTNLPEIKKKIRLKPTYSDEKKSGDAPEQFYHRTDTLFNANMK